MAAFAFLWHLLFTKTLLITAVRPALIQPLSFTILIEKKGIKWKENGNEASIQFLSFQKIIRESAYYSLKLPEKAIIYLWTDQLTKEEQTILNDKLTVQ